MIRAILACFILAWTPVATMAQSLSLGDPAQVDAPSSEIGYANVEATLASLKAKPDVKIQDQDGWTVIVDAGAEQAYTLWSFPPQTHPAAPSAVKRTLLERNGMVVMEMSVRCEAKKAACDALVAEFQAINARIRTEMQQRQ